MTYAIELYFDKELETKIFNLAQKVADNGLSTKFLEWKTTLYYCFDKRR